MTDKPGHEAKRELAEQADGVEEPGSTDEVPGDIRAFYGHPLANGEDTNASALALLHEYQNLPAIDRSDQKVGDKFGGLSEILRQEEEEKKASGSDYSLLLTSDVDAFLNRNGKADLSQIKALVPSPKDEGRKSATPSLSSPSPLLTSGQVRLTEHDSPSPSKCFSNYEHYSSPNSDTSGADDVHTSLTAPLKIVEDITMTESRDTISPKDSMADEKDDVNKEAEFMSDGHGERDGRDKVMLAKERGDVPKQETKPKQLSEDIHKSKKKQKEIESDKSEVKRRSILADALTGGNYKPAGGKASMKMADGHLLTSKPDVIPPPPPYQSPTQTVPVQAGLHLPPVSSICQQIEKEHPHMTEEPLAIIKKSLCAVGFPDNKEESTNPRVKPTMDKSSKGIVHSLLQNKSNRPHFQSVPSGTNVAHSMTYLSKQTESEKSHSEVMQPDKKPKKRKKQPKLQPESLYVPSSQIPTKQGVTSSVLPMQNADTNAVSFYQTVHKNMVSVSDVKPLDSLQKLSLSISSDSSIQSAAHVSRNSLVSSIAASSLSQTFQHNAKPTSLSKVTDAVKHVRASYTDTILQPSTGLVQGMNSTSQVHGSSIGHHGTDRSQTQEYPKITQALLSNAAVTTSMNHRPDHFKRSSSCVDRFDHTSPVTINSCTNNTNITTQAISTTSGHVTFHSEPKVSQPDSPVFVSSTSSISPSPAQYLPSPYSSLPVDQSQFLCHMLGGTVLRPHGSGPASHVIVPKSVFNMATQSLRLPFNGGPVTPTQQGPPVPPKFPASSNPNTVETSSPNIEQVTKSADKIKRQQHLLQTESLDERDKQPYMHSRSVDEGMKQHAAQMKSVEISEAQHGMMYKSEHVNSRPYLMHSCSVEPARTQYVMPPKSAHAPSVAENLSVGRSNQEFKGEVHVPNNTQPNIHADNGYITPQTYAGSWEEYHHSKRPSFLPVTTSSENVSHINKNLTLHSPDTVITQYSDVSDTSSGRQSAPIFEEGTHLNPTDYVSRTISHPFTSSNSLSAPTTPVYPMTPNHSLLPVDHKTVQSKSALDQLHAYTNQMSAIATQYASTLHSRHDLINKAVAPRTVPLPEKEEVPKNKRNTTHSAVHQSTDSSNYSVATQHRYHAEGLVSLHPSAVQGSTHAPASSSVEAQGVHTSVPYNSYMSHSGGQTPVVGTHIAETTDPKPSDKETVLSKKRTKAWINKTHRDNPVEYSESGIHPDWRRAQQSDHLPNTSSSSQDVSTPSHGHRHNWPEHPYTRQEELLMSSYIKEDHDEPVVCEQNHPYPPPYDLSMSKPEVSPPPPASSKSKPVESNNNQPANNVLVIKPQNGPVTPPNAVHAGYPHELKSPDSGYNESCVSPSEGHLVNPGSHGEYTQERSRCVVSDVTSCGKQQMKRRRSVVSSRPQLHVCPEKSLTPLFSIPKLDPSQCHYRCYLETPISASQKINEDKMTYLNKGQYYNLVIEYKTKARPLPSKSVKSRVMVVFREDKCVEDEYRVWEFWHSRQHSSKQRALELDMKMSTGVAPDSAEEVSHNCVSFRWNPLDQEAKVSVSINCLSTDFSNQKGVKGLPLHVEVDTFESDNTPVHRSYCQIKVFCDKGAERKARDEERKKEAKHKDGGKGSKKKAEIPVHPSCDISEFYNRADLMRRPVLYTPGSDTEDLPAKVPYIAPPQKTMLSPLYITSSDEPDVVPCKRPRQVSKEANIQQEKILLYVREKSEEAFTALMLLTPTMSGLARAIEEKYSIPACKIRNVYKRSQKGMLVKMDENIIRHYSNEATFLISIQHTDTGCYDVTLTEVDIS